MAKCNFCYSEFDQYAEYVNDAHRTYNVIGSFAGKYCCSQCWEVFKEKNLESVALKALTNYMSYISNEEA